MKQRVINHNNMVDQLKDELEEDFRYYIVNTVEDEVEYLKEYYEEDEFEELQEELEHLKGLTANTYINKEFVGYQVVNESVLKELEEEVKTIKKGKGR